MRRTQNWVGGNDYSPVGAAYVPPPLERVRPLLGDLCTFVNRIDFAPIVQAGIAHAQFKTIHPFANGNGRVGRAFVYTVLRRPGEIGNYIHTVSLIPRQSGSPMSAGSRATDTAPSAPG